MNELAALLSVLQSRIVPPEDVTTNVQMLLRWIHLLAGITWIGLLYFFNLVSPKVMAELDAPTRGKIIPVLLPRALWWFRWSAVVTVLAGFVYWLQILQSEPPEEPGAYLGRTVGLWLALVVLAFVIQMVLLRVPVLTRRTGLFVIVILLVVGGMGHFMTRIVVYPGASNRAIAIAVGGGIGMFLLLNVWGIVWRAQKRLIVWTQENAGSGAAPPPELALRVRQAQLVSRASFWLTFPMLFLMAAASHYPLFLAD